MSQNPQVIKLARELMKHHGVLAAAKRLAESRLELDQASRNFAALALVAAGWAEDTDPAAVIAVLHEQIDLTREQVTRLRNLSNQVRTSPLDSAHCNDELTRAVNAAQAIPVYIEHLESKIDGFDRTREARHEILLKAGLTQDQIELICLKPDMTDLQAWQDEIAAMRARLARLKMLVEGDPNHDLMPGDLHYVPIPG